MDKNDKIAVVYFSVSGHSERLARRLAHDLNGDLISLKAPCYRPGVFGYLRAGVDSLRQKCQLAPQDFTSLKQYHHLVMCGPIWTSYPATPLRALMKSNFDLPRSVSLFLTSGGASPAEKAFSIAENDLGRPFTATAVLGNSVEDTDEENEILKAFLSDLNAGWDPKLKSVK